MATKKSTPPKKIDSVKDADVPMTAGDYEWPELVFDVPPEAFDNLSFPELRLFLAMMGKPIHEQTELKTKADISNEVHVTIGLDTVRAQLAYDRVIRQLPIVETPPPVPVDRFTATNFWPDYARLIEKTKTDLSQQVISDMLTMSMGKVQATVKEFVDAETKKVRRVEIVLPDGKVSTPKGVLHEQFDVATQLLSQGFPVLLVGPTQCGKTTMARQLAQALKLDFAAQSFSGGLTESKLVGRMLPKKNGAEFCGTPFLSMFEKGGTFLADEIDAADSNVLTSLNMAIANGELWLPERDSKPLAIKHKNFRLIGAANTFGFGADARYVGRNTLDYATLERFGCGVVYMDYDHRIETSLARPELCEWAWALRARIRRAQLNREMSTRTIAVLETMTKAYKWTAKEWDARFFANWSAEEKRMVA